MGAKSNFSQATYELFGIRTVSENERKIAAETGDKHASHHHLTIARVTPELSPHEKTCYIAPGSVFEGNLKTQANVEIAGEFHGDINSAGKVLLRTNIKGNITASELELIECKLTGDVKVDNSFVLGKESSVKGKVFAQTMLCSGIIEGDVFIEKELTLKACAEIKGNIHTATMTMESGAKAYGNLDMGSVNMVTEKICDEIICEE